MPFPHTEIRASLFDRLVDADPLESTEPRPLRALTRAELLDSVGRELTRLLNTRITPAWLDKNMPRTVLDYGIADYTSFFPAGPENQAMLAHAIAQSIAAFEPRLRNVRVRVEQAEQAHALIARIDATLVTETVHEPVSFPINIGHRDAPMEVRTGD